MKTIINDTGGARSRLRHRSQQSRGCKSEIPVKIIDKVPQQNLFENYSKTVNRILNPPIQSGGALTKP